MAEVRKYKKGEVIFKQGEDGKEMYNILFVGGGSVDIILDCGTKEEKLLSTLDGEQFFGEMSLLTGEKRSATAIARTDVSVEVIDRDSFEEYSEKNPKLMKALLKGTTDRLRARTQNYIDALSVLDKYEEVLENTGKPDEELLARLKRIAK